MVSIIDASVKCGSKAAGLRAGGIRTVIRYYSRDTINPSKRLDRSEANALAAVGIRLGVVHEGRYGDKATNFDRATGIADAVYARTYGASTIGQPSGSAIYFGVDFDATPAEIANLVIPYFQGIASAFAEPNGEPTYNVGVYGSGATCAAVLDAGLAQHAWLAQSSGWAGHSKFLKSGRWSLDQGKQTVIAGVDCDSDALGEGQDMGDFLLPSALPWAGQSSGGIMQVNARRGLNLRSGPGVDFDVIKLLPFGTALNAMKSVSAWTMVDLQGDGLSDGFVSGAFLTLGGLQPLGQAILRAHAAPAPALAHATVDSIHVTELIRQGSSEAGLKAAATTAKAAWPAYPTNGCAAHLSALLQQAGIDVPMIRGAGKLAHVLMDRGWTKVDVGSQAPGDVGVCYDLDPSPAGADHIYLVIVTSDSDEMMVADNQRSSDAPHPRYASGHGKTPTEYFLRAQ